MENLQRWMRTWNLEISAVLAVVGLIGLGILGIMFPTALIVVPAALCGWAMGVFHGIQSEINRNKRINYIEGVLKTKNDHQV